MKIGQVAKETGLSVHGVRFYEREGLLEKPAREPSGYRNYSPDVVPRLRFVRRAKELGFSLQEISELLALEGATDASASDVKRLAQTKLSDLEERIRALQRMRRALRKVLEECPGQGPTSGCSILRTLNQEAKP